jgi:hypothetical protein
MDMEWTELKLKQASAVLGVPPKDLQNLVQLNVLRPPRRDNVYWFDENLLLQAKVAVYLKATLGASSEFLGRFTEALPRDAGKAGITAARYMVLRSRPAGGGEPVEIKIPLRALASELEKQLPRAEASPDLPRGRKRTGWKREMRASVEEAASGMGQVSQSQVLEAVRRYRAARKRLPEIGIARPKAKTA